MVDSTTALLVQAQKSLREQLEAAEQAHLERLRQVLAAQDSSQIAALNQAVRRLRADRNGSWATTLVDAAGRFSGRAVLFSVQSSSLHFEMTRNDFGVIGDVPLSDGPAFQAAVDSGDTVVAVRSQREMSAPIAAALGEALEQKFYVFPIFAADRVIALVYADTEGGPVQAEALELLAAVAGALREGRAANAANGLVTITAIEQNDGSAGSAALTPEDRELHLKAQRFARVQMAEIRLYKSENVKNGRSGGDLYTSLQSEIDTAREVFRRDFLSASPTMVDYLHLELVRTLANDDVALLGPDYPGPMA